MAGPKPKSERNKPLELDDAAADALTALLAVRDGLATEAQVESCLQSKKKRATQDTAAGNGAPPPKRLAFLLVEENVLDEAQAKELERRLDPEVLPGFRILGEAGRGGMGTVFRARQLSMDRVVALKILANRLSKDARYVEKFLYEARAAGKLNHENIVSAIDCGAASGFHYFVMEFVDGKTAMELLSKDGALPWEKAFDYAEQVARALEHAHANGLVHRDVKPENVMVSQTVTGTRVKLCDLGLAKEAVEAGTGEKSKMTEGTPAYASPEQALGRTDIDARSDIYSLGATLYHFLSNEAPYEGENARAILWKQVHKPFPDLAQKLPDVPEGLRTLLGKMVEKDREKRLPSARAFLDELAAARKALSAPSTIAASPSRGPTSKGLGVLVVGLLIIIAPLVALALRPAAPPPEKPVDKKTDPVAVDVVDKRPEGRPKIVHLDAPDKPDENEHLETKSSTPDVKRPEGMSGDDAARGAQLLLDRANQFHDQQPDDIQGYATKLRQVVERYPGTPAAVVAQSDLAALDTQGLEAIMKDLDKAKVEAQAQADKGKFKDAVSALDSLSEKWDARVLNPLKPSIEKARQSILDQARNRLAALSKEGDDHLGRGESIDDTLSALAALEQDTPLPVSKEVHAKAEELKSRLGLALADAALRDLVLRRDDALAQGHLEDAEKIVKDAKSDPKLQPRQMGVDALGLETSEIARIWRGFDDKIHGISAESKHVFHHHGGPAIEGQLKDYDTVAWTGKVKRFGLKETVAIDVRDFPPEDLLDLALPSKDPRDLHAAAEFFVARHEVEIATTLLDKAVAAGMADDTVLRAKIAGLVGKEKEMRAARLVAKALAPGAVNASPGDVITAVRALISGFSDTQAYAEKLDDLKKVYVASRVARLTSDDVAQVFSGKLTRVGKDAVKLEYDFGKDGNPARDWTPDAGLTKDSALHWEKHHEYMKGVCRNLAVWEGGAISVDARLITNDARRPNANIIISMKPGWDGVLIGFGLKTGGMNRIKVDASAPKKAGWQIVTPCNVAHILGGKAPDQGGQCLVAEEEPQAAIGRPIRYSVKRDAKGDVSGNMGSSNPIYVANCPKSDEAGQVAIAGLETELMVEHVEIAGKLDQQWLGDQARRLADAEAAAFPAAVKPAPPVKQGGQTGQGN
jgi:serine/threonine-protein kinase